MNANIRQKLAKRIKQLRKRCNLTQEDLAGKAEIAYKHIQRLESKKPNAVKIDTLEKLASAFGVSLSKLFDFHE
ncbi:MAG: helix-turn-helix transcriptional regulator [Candidatus Margulisiibacteriota bacterium]